VIRAISFMFVLRALGQNATAVLNRALRFRAVQTGVITGYVAGFILVAVPMAFAGMGAWSIVVGQLVQATLTSVITVVQVGQMARPTLHGLRPDMIAYGKKVISANLGSWSLSNMDQLLVSHLAGTTSLALYSRSMMLAMMPSQTILSGLQNVLFATAARAQENPDGCRRALLTSLEFLVVIGCPLLFAIAATSRTVLLALYGARWAEASPLLAPLCIASVVNGVLGVFGPIIMGLGKVERETRAQWAAALIMLPVVYLMGHISVVAVAWSIIGLYGIRLALLYRGLHSILPLDMQGVLRALLPGIALGLFAAAGAAACDHTPEAWNPLLRLGMVVAGAGLGCIVGRPVGGARLRSRHQVIIAQRRSQQPTMKSPGP
jgi:O-antigen/teichoic acid export membrane protein